MKKQIAIWQFTDMKTGHRLGLRARTQKQAGQILKDRGYKFKDLKKYKGPIQPRPKPQPTAGLSAPVEEPKKEKGLISKIFSREN